MNGTSINPCSSEFVLILDPLFSTLFLFSSLFYFFGGEQVHYGWIGAAGQFVSRSIIQFWSIVILDPDLSLWSLIPIRRCDPWYWSIDVILDPDPPSLWSFSIRISGGRREGPLQLDCWAVCQQIHLLLLHPDCQSLHTKLFYPNSPNTSSMPLHLLHLHLLLLLLILLLQQPLLRPDISQFQYHINLWFCHASVSCTYPCQSS